MRRLALPLILFASAFALGLGLVLPLLRVERLYFLTDEPSIIAIVAGLWAENEILLATIIALFSIVFPCLKLSLLNIAAYARDGAPGGGVPAWLRALSNWSMLDVMLVALVIFAAKTSGLAAALTQPGLWFFAASAILTAAASALLKSQESREIRNSA